MNPNDDFDDLQSVNGNASIAALADDDVIAIRDPEASDEAAMGETMMAEDEEDMEDDEDSSDEEFDEDSTDEDQGE